MSVDVEKLFHTYYMDIYSYLMTVVKNVNYAEELTQEVFFKALKTKSKYNGKSSEYTWLCAIAKNAANDFLKKNNRFQEMNHEMDSGISIEEKITDQESTLEIHQILHGLEEPYKEVFQLRIFGELSFSNIGKIFGKTENWARVTYHRGRMKIKERMGKKNE